MLDVDKSGSSGGIGRKGGKVGWIGLNRDQMRGNEVDLDISLTQPPIERSDPWDDDVASLVNRVV